NVEIPEVETLVGVSDLLAVRRPERGVEKGGGRTEVKVAHLAHTVLLANLHLVFAGLVGEVGDPLSVRRPGGIAVGDGGRMGKVADITLVGGNRENLAESRRNCANSGGRKAVTAELLGFHLDELRTNLRQISGEVHGNGLQLL